MTGILLTLFLLSLGYAVYLKNFTVPSLEDRVTELENADVKTETVYLPGKRDTVTVIDTVQVFKPLTGPITQTTDVEEPIKKYETAFGDSLVRGTIYNTVIGEGYLSNASIDYKLNRPIIVVERVDTLFRTDTRTITKFVPEQRPWRMQVGLFGGASPNPDMNIYLGPTVGFLTPKDVWVGYSYDVLNDAHLMSYRTTIKFDFFKKISLNPFK